MFTKIMKNGLKRFLPVVVPVANFKYQKCINNKWKYKQILNEKFTKICTCCGS